MYINVSLAQNIHLFCSNGEIVNPNDLEAIMEDLIGKTGRTNLYFSWNGKKKKLNLAKEI